MVKFEGLLLVISLALTLFSFVDCAMRDETQVQRLPKWGWLLVIFFFGAIGAISYLYAGRLGSRGISQRKPQKKKILPPDDDPDFLKGL